jgi:hypothetical protein
MLVLRQARLRGDVAHRAALGTGAEQRALRPAQHLDAVDVEGLRQRVVGIEGQRAHLDRRVVEIDAGGAGAAGRGDAADREMLLVPELSTLMPGVKRATSWMSLMPRTSMLKLPPAVTVRAVTLIGTLLSMISS